jgi:hypothetical protein
LAGCSENISEGAQRAAGFVSKFASGEWDRLYDGSELQEQRTIFGRYRTNNGQILILVGGGHDAIDP